MPEGETMIEGLKPYGGYKESGVSWLGKIPSHWGIGPGFAAFRENQTRNFGLVETQVLSLSYGKIVIKSMDKLHGLVPDNFETYQIVEPGDIIIRPTDLQNDKTSLRVGLVRDRGIITSAYICLKAVGAMSSAFGHQLLLGLDLMKVFYGLGSGLRQNLSFTDFKRLPIFVPPPDEQATIVRFLDHANQRIDRFIRTKKKVIALLNEQKQAIIHRAVTRGIDPDVKMKDSGIPWLGEIPEHWEIKKVKHLTNMVGGMTPNKSQERFWRGKIPWVSPKDMKVREILDSKDHISESALTQTRIALINPPAVLIVVRGMILARTFPTAISMVPITINQDMKAIIPKAKLNPEFFVSLLTGIQKEILGLVELAGHGTCCLRTDSWSSFEIPLPPILEQTRISNYLKSQLIGQNEIVRRTELEIELIREYRTRLIADVVTGKVDVREAARNLPATAEEIPLEPDTEDLDEESESELEPTEAAA